MLTTMPAALNQSCFPGLFTARFVDIAAIVGADAVELRPLDHPETPGEAAMAVRASGLPVAAVNALMDWALPDDLDPRPALITLLEIAVAVEAPLVVCVAPIRAGRLPPRTTIARSAAERLAMLAEVARPAGVQLALEQVGRSSTRPDAVSGIRHLDDALAIAVAAAADVLLVADSYNLATADEDFDVLRAIPGRRLGIAHLVDAEGGARAMPGIGNLDLPRFVRALGATSYSGALSLELFPRTPWPDPLSFAREAIAAVRRGVGWASTV